MNVLPTYQTIQKKVHHLLEDPAYQDRARQLIIYVLFTLISLNVVIIVIETQEGLNTSYEPYFLLFHVVSIGIFSVEYILRLWACTVDPRYQNPVKGRLKFAFSPMMLMDLVAIAPFYLPVVMPLDFMVLRLVRLTRVFKVLELGTYSHAWDAFLHILRSKLEEIVVSFILIFIILTISATAMYYVEHVAQPAKFANIADAMWWGVITLSTVGYGDVYPITPLGKLIGAVVALSGIGLFALPTGIIAAGFTDYFHKRRCEIEGKTTHSEHS